MAESTSVALIQLCASADVSANLAGARELLEEAAAGAAAVALLPEAFAFLGPAEQKAAILEPLDDNAAATPILDWCRTTARELGLHLIVGGFHERANAEGMSYNSCLHLDPAGALRARYRKVHLFDVELDDGTSLEESARTLPGDTLVTTELPFGTLGLSVCYDLRFPHLYQGLVDRGAIALTVPSAFTATTGAAHWEALLRARAIETQCYVLAPAQHGTHAGGRRSYGHSLVVDPWGEVVAELPDGDGVLTATIDPARVAAVRRQLPSLQHRRPVT
jgi:predicted amidohydrolase